MTVVGARPNFMKLVPLEREFQKYATIEHISVHTGQHYDKNMSEVFFQDLGLAQPVRFLGVGSGGHGEMTGKIMIEFEKVCLEMKPDIVIVVGDVNSTIAASLVARKLSIPVAHVEAGLRSFDESMPEELNRKLTDCLSNFLFVSEPSGVENLAREGTDMKRVHLVGDIMLETLQLFLPYILRRKKWDDFGFTPFAYAVVTFHRPANVDDITSLQELLDILALLPYPSVFPVHPRTEKKLKEFGMQDSLHKISTITLTPPMAYIDFLSLVESAAVVLSDSGSIQAETSFFNVPCLVCRDNTERPFYLEHGTSELVGRDITRIEQSLATIQNGQFKQSDIMIKKFGINVAFKIVKTIAQA